MIWNKYFREGIGFWQKIFKESLLYLSDQENKLCFHRDAKTREKQTPLLFMF
jgi:hypothetical protein